MAEVVEVTDVDFTYGIGKALQGINLQVASGEFVGAIGPNGGGKTTLLKLIAGLLVPTSGQVRVFGQPAARSGRLIGYVPQFADVDRAFPITVEDVVLMGRLGLTSFLGGYREGDKKAARRAMEQVGVWELRQRRLGNLSEGQRQRVLIARALAGEPKLLLLDEPTASVDAEAEAAITEVLGRLHKSITIVMVSHDLELLKSHVDRIVYVNRRLQPVTGDLDMSIGRFLQLGN
ncbi:MAG: ABC transporter ATP-binding protein [Firmicutes bacterium]|nr:ABC transporter ATP-binding protein [Bacillota bacterium]